MKNFVYLYLHFYTKKSLQFYTKKSLHILHIHTHFNQTQAHAYKQIKAVRSKHIVEMYRKIHCTRQSDIYELLQATCISWLLEAMIGICADRDTKLVNLPKQTQNEPIVGCFCFIHLYAYVTALT